jgi:hypothetical protein
VAWENGPLKVYHGTDRHSAESVVEGISLGACRPLGVDFGRGFYVTTVLAEAWCWAETRARIRRAEPAVVAFDLDREAASKLSDHLAFTLASSDFFDFVEYNRVGLPNHARLGRPDDNPPIPPVPYEIVYGPVSRYPDRDFEPDWDQICLLSEAAIDCLSNATLENDN